MALKRWPDWIDPALQGVAFWIAHRRCLFPHYPLAEAALVAEICNLVQAHLPDELILNCEIQYRKISPGPAIGASTKSDSRIRADLVVSDGPIGEKETAIKAVLEVKRAKAGPGQIELDLQRLADLREKLPNTRAFLVVIAEAHRPDRYVNENGAARKKKQSISDKKAHFRVRRVWKAAHAFSNPHKAQYACLLEVLL